ncbi:MAG: phenylalanine--tRNA ligase subunit beta [Alphaproteobacteria bacterium]|nr:phenylalanine--tRNA ligase subunit beta [Alphaproteobacteria bacterium]
MVVGLGTGSTAKHFVEMLAEEVADGLVVRGVPTSEETRRLAEAHAIPLVPVDTVETIHLTVDGADECDPEGRLIKGGGAALLREKIIADASDHMVVIADEREVHDIAGIMGGENSGVADETTDVLLEIAYFDPARIGVTGRKLGLASDARTRFERGVDPAFLDMGLELLTGLIVELAGGQPSEVVRAGSPPSEHRRVAFDTGLTRRLGGVDVPEDEQKSILESLDFSVDADWNVTCPLRRHDIEGPADLVEEVVRIHGLDTVESVALPRAEGVACPTATPQQVMERRLRRAAAASGLDEAVTWSFLPESEAAHFAPAGAVPWSLENPISEDLKVMRPSLLPGLLMAAKRNADRGAAATRLFELGRRYFRSGDGTSDERPTLGIVFAGEKTPRGWASGKGVMFDAFDAKAAAMTLLEWAGARTFNLMVMGEAGPQFHPAQSATLRLGPKTVLARFGMLHPATLRAFDIDGPVAAVELFLDAIPAKKAVKGPVSFARPGFTPPALQAVTRDFAFLLPEDVPAGDLVRVVQGADKANIVAARVFDLFTGEGVPDGKKSLAIEVTLQPSDTSYKDADLKRIADKVVAAAAGLGAELRG